MHRKRPTGQLQIRSPKTARSSRSASCSSAKLVTSVRGRMSVAVALLAELWGFLSCALGFAGWTYGHFLGRRGIQSAFREQIVTEFVENVPEEAEGALSACRELAKRGCGLVFGCSFSYMDPMVQCSHEYPATKFVHIAGYKTTSNLNTAMPRIYEGRYRFAASLSTQS
jgi:basic membrane lipoprotein Med (substrate-binding protein (PBP1-ABC) superfamily)